MNNYTTLRYEVAEHILTLTLNRPEQMNAFTVEMSHELIHAFNRASEDDEVRAIVVTGAGKAFCAGMDLSIEGNVFGLNEHLQPTMKDMQDKLNDPEPWLMGCGTRAAKLPWPCSIAKNPSSAPSTARRWALVPP
jgi:enoyl-CoA hydratase/carnithine racemase